MSFLGELWAVIQTYRHLLGVAAMFLGPPLLSRIMRFAQQRHQLQHQHQHQHAHPPAHPPPPRSRIMQAIVVLHALYAVYCFYAPPYDVFTKHSLPIRTRSEVLRPLLLRDSGIRPDQIESQPLISLLLTRLTSLDGRYAYARWGHTTFIRCAWCTEGGDYMLAGLPRLLAPYAGEAFLIGAMGWQTVGGAGATERKIRFRSAAGWALGAMLAIDLGARWLWEIRASPGIDGDCTHLDTILFQLRTIALFVTTATYVFYPLPQDGRANDLTLVRTLDGALQTLRLTSLARTAVARSPALSRIGTEVRDKKARVEDAARLDPAVTSAAQEGGLTENIELRKANAREWIDTQWARVVR